MRRSRLAACGTLGAALLVLAATGVAPAASPTAVASQAFVAGAPSAISCHGSVDARVSVTGQSATSGNATDVEIVVDLSGSTATPFANIKQAANDAVDALDGADGAANGTLAVNAAGLYSYRDSSVLQEAALTTDAGALHTAIDHLLAPAGGSPHALAISTAAGALASSAHAKAIILITDGQTTSSGDATSANDAATAAKNGGVRIITIGVGTADTGHLTDWSTPLTTVQSGTPGPINRATLLTDLGAAVSTPATFTVTQTPSSTFSLGAVASPPTNPSTGAVSGGGPGSVPLQWTGSVATGQTATLVYHATRSAGDVFSTQSEVVSTTTITSGNGTATVASPATLSINVLPCNATPIAATTCTGAACNASGTAQDGTQYALSAGAAPAGTAVTLAGLNAPPPAGTCPGFHAHTTGAEFDIRPLTRDATFRMVIPKASLGTLRWFQTDVCLGTNLKFITAIQSLANLSPESPLVAGVAPLPGRYWGLLPSIPRIDWFPGRGFVVGPWITSRSQDATGNAVITFIVPFVSNSTGFTTDGKAGYDPKLWG